MPPAPSAFDVERRKHVRLRLRPDLSIAPHKYEGRTFYVVKDPVSLRYYRFKEQEHFLIRLMDGKHTLDEAQKEFEKHFRPDRLTLEDLEQFGQQLIKAGLVQNESPNSGKQLFEQQRKRKRTQTFQKFTNILYIKIPIFDPERLLMRMLPYVRFVFTPWFMIVSVLFMLSALTLVLTHFDTFRAKLPSFQEFFSFKTVIYLWAALGIVKVIHEFGHGLSCKAFGGEVHEMGFLFLCLSPAMYCNVSDAWTLPNKWKRIIISGAGIYVELMIAALATFIWWYTPSQPFINYMALSLMVVCSVSTVVFNGNPLMRYDGYYVLSDLLEIPNLREKANRYLKRVVMEYCLGIETQPEPYMALWRRILFVSYAVISYVYRWVITFVILYFIATFLKPYKLEILSNMLALVAAGSMIGWPLYRLGKGLHKRGRLPDMKMFNTTITSIVVAGVVIGFFVLPLPVTRIRETGVVQLEPTAYTPVYVKVDGVLDAVHVKEGQFVRKGAVLATFSNMQLTLDIAAKKTNYVIQSGIVQLYDRQLSDAGSDPQIRSTLQKEQTEARAELKRAKHEWDFIQNEVARQLTVVAPRDGVVMGVPTKDDIGKYWEKDKSGPLLSIGEPSELRVLVPVSPDDFELLRENVARAKEQNREVPVTIRVQGRGLKNWEGRIVLSRLPRAVAKNIPLELSNKAGGPLAVKPTQDPNQLIPMSQVYLVPISIIDPDTAIVPGAVAQVKIHNDYHSAAWWVWRMITKTFDLRLM